MEHKKDEGQIPLGISPEERDTKDNIMGVTDDEREMIHEYRKWREHRHELWAKPSFAWVPIPHDSIN